MNDAIESRLQCACRYSMKAFIIRCVASSSWCLLTLLLILACDMEVINERFEMLQLLRSAVAHLCASNKEIQPLQRLLKFVEVE